MTRLTNEESEIPVSLSIPPIRAGPHFSSCNVVFCAISSRMQYHSLVLLLQIQFTPIILFNINTELRNHNPCDQCIMSYAEVFPHYGEHI